MIELTAEPIDPVRVIDSVRADSAGAVVTFDGTVRDESSGKSVTHLYYEGHAPVALREMEAIRDAALGRWPLTGAAVVHRLGRLEVGESSVFIAVSSAHRGPAFEACQFIIDTLKQRVPIWKKECFTDGEVWVEGPGNPSSR